MEDDFSRELPHALERVLGLPPAGDCLELLLRKGDRNGLALFIARPLLTRAAGTQSWTCTVLVQRELDRCPVLIRDEGTAPASDSLNVALRLRAV